MCGNILGGTEKRSGPPGLCRAIGAAHGCPERATIHLIYAASVHRRRPFKSKQSPRGRRGGVSCTLYVIRIVFLQKPLRTTKSSHPLDCTCRKVFSTSNGHVQYINDDHWFF